MFSVYADANPYAKGILRIAPIKESIETAPLRISNIVLGYVRDSTVTSSTAGTYYVNKGTDDDPIYTEVTLPADYVDGTVYYKFDSSTSNLLEPIKDITDICGVNPSEITYGKNTMSSENSGRVLEDLNMIKDILGRVWDISITFSVLSPDKLQRLDDYFMNKTDTFDVTDNSSEETETKSVTKYVIWYYAEISLPNGIIKDIFYVGDSSFNNMSTIYRTIDADNGLTTRAYAQNVLVNLIGKSSIGGLKNSDYVVE